MTTTIKTVAAILGLLAWLPPVIARSPWDEIDTPLPGQPRAIGSYNVGCLAGAVALPLTGEGYQVMRPSRNRYYGHPRLIAFIQRLGRQAAAGDGRLLIGDLSQPRGGPMAYGHSSHQIGLDADIWFREGTEARALSPSESEALPMLSVIKAAEGRVDAARWSPRYRDILKLAAESAEVERIFVNPVIKLALCRSELDRAWLHKLRPWWGHDAHFHVRLRCPPRDPHCLGQPPPQPGDGCDGDLKSWVREIQAAAGSPKRPPSSAPRPVALPALCGGVLEDRSQVAGRP